VGGGAGGRGRGCGHTIIGNGCVRQEGGCYLQQLGHMVVARRRLLSRGIRAPGFCVAACGCLGDQEGGFSCRGAKELLW
jgi:hypothetical protein